MKKQKTIKNEYGKTIGQEYNEQSESVAMFQEHLSVQDAADMQAAEKNKYNGKLDAEIIYKAGISSTGRVWTYGKAIRAKALVLHNFDPAQFLALLQGINGICAEEVADEDGFPIGLALKITPDELNDRLKGCRVCTLDNEPISIRP